MTTFVAGGRTSLTQPLIVTTSTSSLLSLPSSLTGSYQFTYYFVNRVGATNYAPATGLVTVGSDTVVTLSVPLDLIKSGEIWHSIVFCARRNSGQWFPVYEHFLFDINDYLDWRHCHNTIVPDVVLNKVDHYKPFRTVAQQNDLLTVNASDWLNGSVVFVDETGTFYKTYKAPYLSFNVPTILNNDNDTAFAYCSYGTSNPADLSLSSNKSLVELRGVNFTHKVINYQPIYTGSGEVGFPLYFVLGNNSSEAVPQGTRVGFNFFIQDDDYSAQLGHLFCARNLGFVNLTTFDWDKTDGQSTADMLGLNVERKCLPEQNNFILTRNLPDGWGMLVQVYPKFHLYQLPATIPNLFDVFIEPFLFLHPTKYVELGEVFGDFILDADGRRFVLPDPYTTFILKSGSGLVKNYYFRQLADIPLVGVQSNSNANQYIYLDVNGYPKVSSTLITGTDANIHSLRAIVKTQSGYTQPYLIGTYNINDTANFTFNHIPADKIRDSYPVIGNFNVFSKGKFCIVVKIGTSYKMNTFIYDRQIENYTFEWTTAQDLTNGWSDLNIISDPLFGFWSPANRIQDLSFTSGSSSAEIYLLDYYDGNVLSYADHRPESGCIPVLKGTIQQFISILSNYGQAVNTVDDLKALDQSQIQDYQQRFVLYPKPSLYIYYPESLEQESLLICKPNHISETQPGRWKKVAYESCRGYAHLYKVNNLMNYGVLRYVHTTTEHYLELSYKTYENFAIDRFIDLFDTDTRILVHSAFNFAEAVDFVISSKVKISDPSDSKVCWRLYINSSLSNFTHSSSIFSENNFVYLSASVFKANHFQSIYRASIKILESAVSPANGEITAYQLVPSSLIYRLNFSNVSLNGKPFSLISSLLNKKSIILLRPLEDLAFTSKVEVLSRTDNQVTIIIDENFIALDNKEVEVIALPNSFTKSDFDIFVYDFSSVTSIDDLQAGQFYISENELLISKQTIISYNNDPIYTTSFFGINKVYEVVNRSGSFARFVIVKQIEDTPTAVKFYIRFLETSNLVGFNVNTLCLFSFKHDCFGIPVFVNEVTDPNFVPDSNDLDNNFVYLRLDDFSNKTYVLFASQNLNISLGKLYCFSYDEYNISYFDVLEQISTNEYLIKLRSDNFTFDSLAYFRLAGTVHALGDGGGSSSSSSSGGGGSASITAKYNGTSSEFSFFVSRSVYSTYYNEKWTDIDHLFFLLDDFPPAYQTTFNRLFNPPCLVKITSEQNPNTYFTAKVDSFGHSFSGNFTDNDYPNRYFQNRTPMEIIYSSPSFVSLLQNNWSNLAGNFSISFLEHLVPDGVLVKSSSINFNFYYSSNHLLSFGYYSSVYSALFIHPSLFESLSLEVKKAIDNKLPIRFRIKPLINNSSVCTFRYILYFLEQNNDDHYVFAYIPETLEQKRDEVKHRFIAYLSLYPTLDLFFEPIPLNRDFFIDFDLSAYRFFKNNFYKSYTELYVCYNKTFIIQASPLSKIFEIGLKLRESDSQFINNCIEFEKGPKLVKLEPLSVSFLFIPKYTPIGLIEKTRLVYLNNSVTLPAQLENSPLVKLQVTDVNFSSGLLYYVFLTSNDLTVTGFSKTDFNNRYIMISNSTTVFEFSIFALNRTVPHDFFSTSNRLVFYPVEQNVYTGDLQIFEQSVGTVYSITQVTNSGNYITVTINNPFYQFTSTRIVAVEVI
ncbi:MAG: hypothetical protein ABIK61_07910 [candidate division WOR-3 bacterium]